MIKSYSQYYKKRDVQEESMKSALIGAGLGLSTLVPGYSKPEVSFKMPAPQVRTVALTKMSQEDLIAATLVLEGRGEGVKGMQAIFEVIMNRASTDRKSPSQIVLAPKQFACFSNIKNINQYVQKVKTQHAKSFEIAKQIVMSRPTNYTKGARWYHTTAINPSWGKELIKRGAKTITIGNHIFYYF